ncbi:MAG: vitamin B12 dependent methionine synthase [Chloroflexi bacterium]|nr:vitamin B12 dependent methionine synthase [Chloroflexota bacterium]
MDAVVLNPLPFQIVLPQLFQTFRVREGSATAEEVGRLAAEAQAIGRPKAIYRLGFIDEKGADYVVVDGVKFTSRILRVNLDSAQRVFAYVVTSGWELETWARSQEDLSALFWADRLNQAVLGSAYGAFQTQLKDFYQIGQTSRMNPGSLADWPLEQQNVLFGYLGQVQAAIGVELTESLLMTPTKSVSGILFPSEETFASCQLCPRPVCPNRRAPYDPVLLETKYRGQDPGASATETSAARPEIAH